MNLLILNYDFPPNPGIGGRRWAKLAKSLAIQGHRIEVVKASFPEGADRSAWEQDVIHANITVHSAERKYPKAISHPRNSLPGKINFRLHKTLLSFREKGTIYDQSIGWKKSMLPLCQELIRTKQIDAIIASGAPWNLLVYAAELKAEFPHCKLLIDYRDPWLNARNYGMANLSKQRMNAEIKKQEFIFEHADAVSSPYEYLTTQLSEWSQRHCTHQPRFSTLPHFFDPEDFSENVPCQPNDVFRMVYAGDIYVGSEPQWEEFRMLVDKLSTATNFLPHKLQVDVYTSAEIPDSIRNANYIHVHRPVGKLIFDLMRTADVLLVVLPENKKNERTTKFFEYLPLRIPLFVVSPPGEVTRYVETNRLGVCSTQDLEAIRDLFTGVYARESFKSNFDIDSCTNHQRAKDVIHLIS